MVTFMLQQGRAVPLPAQLLVVRLQTVVGQPLPELDALVIEDNGGERLVADVTRHPGMLVLGVSERTTIRLRPPSGMAVFAAGSTFSVVIGPESPDSDRVVLSSVDASGLKHRDVVMLMPVGEEIIVTATAETRRTSLPPLATRARDAAREVLRTSSDQADRQVAVQVALDGSASMRAQLDSGSVEQVLELLMGTGDVISSSQRIMASVCGQSLTRLPDQKLETFAAPVVAAAQRVPSSVGFRSALVPDGGADMLTYVVTDAVPADLSLRRSDALHLVILSGIGQDAVEALPEQVGATVIAPPKPAVVTEGGAVTAQNWSTTDQTELTTIVASLLSSYRHRFEEGPQ